MRAHRIARLASIVESLNEVLENENAKVRSSTEGVRLEVDIATAPGRVKVDVGLLAEDGEFTLDGASLY